MPGRGGRPMARRDVDDEPRGAASVAVRARPAAAVRPPRHPAPALRGARPRLQPREGPAGAELREDRSPDRVPRARAPREGRAGGVAVGGADLRPRAARVRHDAARRAGPRRVDAGDQGGAGPPRAGPPALPGHRDARRDPGRGGRWLGRGARVGLVAGVADLGRAAPPASRRRGSVRSPLRRRGDPRRSSLGR